MIADTGGRSGSVCLDVINQTWSPMFGELLCSLVSQLNSSIPLVCCANTLVELINIFEIFLPQLLRYPNPSDPLNGEAAALLMRDPKAYAKKVETYVERFATPEDADQARGGDDDDDDDEEDEELGNGEASRPKAPTRGTAPPTNGHSTSNGHATTNGHANGTSKERKGEEEEEDSDGDKMSDMGELSDGDEFMGEMDD